MKSYDYLAINFAAITGLIFLSVFLYHNSRISKSVKKTFYFLILIESLEIIFYNCELCTSTLSYPTLWRILFSVIGYSIRPIITLTILFIMMRNYTAPRLKGIMIIPAAVNILIVSTAFFSGICFSYTNDNRFLRGTLGYSPHITLAVYLIIMVIYSNLTKKSPGKKFEFLIIYMMAIVITACVIIEMFYPVRSIGRTAIVLCTVFYYMYFQTEEYNRELGNERMLIDNLIIKNSHDPMTGLLNKNVFTKSCQDILDSHNHKSISYIFIDLDHFKDINDTLGHTAGDEAILDAACNLKRLFRGNDMVCRFGGDEFCICLCDLPYDVLCSKLHDCCNALRNEYCNDAQDKRIWVTSSIGAAHSSCCNSIALDELLRVADQALYEAKDQGRNRFVVKTVN